MRVCEYISGPVCGCGEARWGRALPKTQLVFQRHMGGAWPEGLRAILSKWFLPTRLETRTKESKTNASMVVEKPTCAMKVIDANARAASTDHDPLEKGLSKSVILRTRKMVNYA